MFASKWTINKNSPLPYYHQIEKFVMQEIVQGRLNKGEYLPAEGEMAVFFGVSVSVVRNALDRLEENKVIHRQRGKKAVVVFEAKKKLRYFDEHVSLYSELVSKGYSVRTKVLGIRQMQPSERIGSFLDMRDQGKVVQISRLRYVNEKPMIYWISYLPLSLCPDLDREELTDKSLYQVISEKYNLIISGAKRSLDVIMADNDVSMLLEVPIGESIIHLQSVSYTREGAVLEYYEAWHEAAEWEFTFEISNKAR